jgi:hypothetical protein
MKAGSEPLRRVSSTCLSDLGRPLKPHGQIMIRESYPTTCRPVEGCTDFPGGCPHAAIREDISANLHALEELQAVFDCEMLFVESGGDNLAGKSVSRCTWDGEGGCNVVEQVLRRSMMGC